MRVLRAAAAAACVALLSVGVPWALLRWIGSPWPAEGVAWSAPMTDAALIGVLAFMVWVLWAQLMACLLVEFVAALSGGRFADFDVPFTLGVQQQFARQLVMALVVVGASATVVGPATYSYGAPPAPNPNTPAITAPTAAQLPAPRTTRPSAVKVTTITVMRLDSLWSIAEQHLGDGARWPEIAALNEGRQMNDGTKFLVADDIRPGWELLIPSADDSDIRTAQPGSVIVDRGDSLSEIAQDRLGDAARWPTLYALNKATIGGDPDLIQPGQVLRLPAPPRAGEHQPRPEQDITSPPQLKPTVPDLLAPTAPTATPQAPAKPPAVAGSPAPDQSAADDADRPKFDEATTAEDAAASPLWILLGAASCLAVGALGALRANRRRQMRTRRVGRVVASSPPELAEIEEAVVASGENAHNDVEFLDRALRHVAASARVAGDALPHIGAAALSTEELTLLFVAPTECPVPEGWSATEDSRAWMLPRDTVLEAELEDQSAPYPALVSVGMDEDQRTWLIDLESLGVCGIAGAPDRVEGLVRYMVAELALNAWSAGSHVLLADDFASELVGLDPTRVQVVDRGQALARAASVLDESETATQRLGSDVWARRRDQQFLDGTDPLIVWLSERDDRVAARIARCERSRVVLVHGSVEEPAVRVGDDGTAYLARWGINVKAFALEAPEAEAMAALLVATSNVQDRPMPNADGGPLREFARVDGTLRDEFVQPRNADRVESSTLPLADEVYLASAATTTEDVATLAPHVPDQTKRRIEDVDPALEDDLAEWFDENSTRPKVRLLGPVDVTSRNGGDPSTLKNLGGAVSFIAYLACQERGVTGERAAAAFGWQTTRTVQNRATDARYLLGHSPEGTDFLPDASASEGAMRGTPTYELSGAVLVDANLFTRLRFRSQKKTLAGDEAGGRDDLWVALSMVRGAPFEAASDRRYPWLFHGQRFDDILVATVHDTAHLLATQALAHGEPQLARMAAEAALRANTNADVPWLDLAAASEAENGHDSADAVVREHVTGAEGDDLPQRTEKVLDLRKWAV